MTQKLFFCAFPEVVVLFFCWCVFFFVRCTPGPGSVATPISPSGSHEDSGFQASLCSSLPHSTHFPCEIPFPPPPKGSAVRHFETWDFIPHICLELDTRDSKQRHKVRDVQFTGRWKCGRRYLGWSRLAGKETNPEKESIAGR